MHRCAGHRINVSEAVSCGLKTPSSSNPRGPMDLKGRVRALTWFLDAAFRSRPFPQELTAG